MNEAFLVDLERMLSPDGYEVGGIGDVALKHFRERRGFENYKQYYAKREEAQAIFEREVRKTSGSGFSAFIDVRPPVPFRALRMSVLQVDMKHFLRTSPSALSCAPLDTAHQIRGGSRQPKSRRPPRTAYGTRPANTTVYTTLPTNDKANAST